MKRICTIVTSLFLLLTMNTSCEDNYRSLVLFEGVAPIYQIGTCDNLVSAITLYLTDLNGIVLGIDGGDGAYQFETDNQDVAIVTSSEDVNGYQRVRITPKKEGVANLIVRDGVGALTKLNIRVHDAFRFHAEVKEIAYQCTSEISEELWDDIQAELIVLLPMQAQGTYTFVPNNRESPYWGGGTLYVHSVALAQAFQKGTYEMVKGEEGESIIRFLYNNQVHDLTSTNSFNQLDGRMDVVAPVITMFEDVTQYVTKQLPADCRIYRLEKWMYKSDAALDGNKMH